MCIYSYNIFLAKCFLSDKKNKPKQHLKNNYFLYLCGGVNNKKVYFRRILRNTLKNIEYFKINKNKQLRKQKQRVEINSSPKF